LEPALAIPQLEKIYLKNTGISAKFKKLFQKAKVTVVDSVKGGRAFFRNATGNPNRIQTPIILKVYQ